MEKAVQKTGEKKASKLGMTTVLRMRRFCVYLILIFLTLLCLFPIWTLLVNMTRSNGQISTSFSLWFGTSLIDNFKAVFGDSHLPVLSALGNSAIVAVLSSVLCVYFSALTAYAIQVYDFKFKDLIFKFILVIMMIPTTISGVGLARMLTEWGQTNMLWPLIIPSIASPVTFFYMKQYMESVLPLEMIEAARVDGANEFRIFNTMCLPIIEPALAVQLIFAFVSSWNNFFIPALIISDNGKKTLPLIISALKASDPSSFDLGKVYALIGFAIIPLVIVYLFLSRFIVAGMTEGSVKG